MKETRPKKERAHRAGDTDKKKLLLKAAFEEVAEQGFSSVTLEAIAERARVSKGVTLYYFESKEQLFRELFRWVIDWLHQRMVDEISRHQDARDQLEALIDVIFTSPEKNRAFFAVFIDFSSLAVRNELFRKVNAQFYTGCTRIENELVARGVDQGVFPPQDVEATSLLLRSLFDGLMLRWLSEESPDTTFALYHQRCREYSFRILGIDIPERRTDHELHQQPDLPA